MDIQKQHESFQEFVCEWQELEKDDPIFAMRNNKYLHPQMQDDFELWQRVKAQAVPECTWSRNDRLLVKSIREHVESHISEISVNDLFDKGWLAAMKCIQNNIDMLEAQEPAND